MTLKKAAKKTTAKNIKKKASKPKKVVAMATAEAPKKK